MNQLKSFSLLYFSVGFSRLHTVKPMN